MGDESITDGTEPPSGAGASGNREPIYAKVDKKSKKKANKSVSFAIEEDSPRGKNLGPTGEGPMNDQEDTNNMYDSPPNLQVINNVHTCNDGRNITGHVHQPNTVVNNDISSITENPSDMGGTARVNGDLGIQNSIGIAIPKSQKGVLNNTGHLIQGGVTEGRNQESPDKQVVEKTLQNNVHSKKLSGEHALGGQRALAGPQTPLKSFPSENDVVNHDSSTDHRGVIHYGDAEISRRNNTANVSGFAHGAAIARDSTNRGVIGSPIANATVIGATDLDKEAIGISEHQYANDDYSELDETLISNSEFDETLLSEKELDETLVLNSKLNSTAIPNQIFDTTVIPNSDRCETVVPNSKFDITVLPSSEVDNTVFGDSKPEKDTVNNSKHGETSEGNLYNTNNMPSTDTLTQNTNSKIGYPMYGSNSAFVGYHVLKMTGAVPSNYVEKSPPNSDISDLSTLIATSELTSQGQGDPRFLTPAKNKRNERFRGRSGSEGGEVLEFSSFKAPLGPQNSLFYAMKNNMIDKTVRFALDGDGPFERAHKKSKGWSSVRNIFATKSKIKPRRLEISSPSPISAAELMQSSLSKEQLSKLVLPVGTPRTNYKNPGNVRFLGNSSTENNLPPLDKKVSWSYESIRFADDGEDEEGVYSSIDVSPKITDGRSGLVSPLSISGSHPPANDHLQLPKAAQQAEKSHVQLLSPQTSQNPVAPSSEASRHHKDHPILSQESLPQVSFNFGKGLSPSSDQDKGSVLKDRHVSPPSNEVEVTRVSSPVVKNKVKSVENTVGGQQNTFQRQASLRSDLKLPLVSAQGEEPKQERLQEVSLTSRDIKSSEVGGSSTGTSNHVVNQPKIFLSSVISHEVKNRTDVSEITEQIQSREQVHTSQTLPTSSGDQQPYSSLQLSQLPYKNPLTSLPQLSPKREPALNSQAAHKKELSPGHGLSNVNHILPVTSSLPVSVSPHGRPIPPVRPIPRVSPTPADPIPPVSPLPPVRSIPLVSSIPPVEPLPSENPLPFLPTEQSSPTEQSAAFLQTEILIKNDLVDIPGTSLVTQIGSPKTNTKKQSDKKHSVPAVFFKENKKSSPLIKNKLKTEKKEAKISKVLNESTAENLTVPIYSEVQKVHPKKKSWFGSLTRRFGSKSRLKPEKEPLKPVTGKPKSSAESNLDSFYSFVENEVKLGPGGDIPFDAKRTSVHGNISEIVPLKHDRKAVSMGNVHSAKKANKTQTHDLPITPTEIYEKRAFESSTANPSVNNRYINSLGTSHSSFGKKKSVSSSALTSKSERFTPRVVGVVFKKGESLDSVIDAQPKELTVQDHSGDPEKVEVTSKSNQPKKLTLNRSRSDGTSRLNSSYDPSTTATRVEKNNLKPNVLSKDPEKSLDVQNTPNSVKKLLVNVEYGPPGVQEIPAGNSIDVAKINLKGSDVSTEAQVKYSTMKQEQDFKRDGLKAFRRRFKDDSFDKYQSKSSPNDTWESILMDPDQKTTLHKSRSVERPPVVRTHHHVTRSASEPRFRRDKTFAPKASELVQASKMAPILADHMNKHKQIVCQEAGVQLHFQQNQIMANRRLLVTDLDDVFSTSNSDQPEGKTLRSSVSLDSSESTHQSLSRKLSSSSQTSGDRVSVQLRPRSISFEGTDIREYPVSQYRPETEKMIAEAKRRQKEEETKKHQMTTHSFDEARPKGSRHGKASKGKSKDLLIQEAKMGKQDSLPVQRITSYDIPEQHLKDKTRINDVPIREDRLVKNPIYQSISEKDYTSDASLTERNYIHSHVGVKSVSSSNKQDSLASYNSVMNESVSNVHHVIRHERHGPVPKVSSENGFSEYVPRGMRQHPEHRSLSRTASSVSQNQSNYSEQPSASTHRCNHPDHHPPPPSVASHTKQPGHSPSSSQSMVFLQKMTEGGVRAQQFSMARQYPVASTTHQMVAHNVLAYPTVVSVPMQAYGYPPHCYVPVMQTHQVTQPYLSSSSLNIYQGQLPVPLQNYDAYYQMRYRAHTPYRPLHPGGYGRYRPAEGSVDEPYVGPYYEHQGIHRDRPDPAKDTRNQAVYKWASQRLAHESPEVQARYRHQGQPIRGALPPFRPMASRAQNRTHHPVIIEEIDDKQRLISPLAYSTLKGKGGRPEEDAGIMSEAETASTRLRRTQAAPPRSPEAEEEAAMSEAETASTGRGRHLKPRGNLPIVKTHSKTLERPMGVVFLQFRDETKRALLPNEVTTLDTVKALFVRSFPNQLSMDHLEKPAVKMYIKDTDTDLFYQLQDLEDVQDRSVLKIFEGDSEDSSRRPSIASTLDSLLRGTDGGWDASDQPEMTEAELEAEFAAEAATHGAGKTYWLESSH